jgi:glutamate/tyrosine decarboxylase-like PLP-dependent enzyme
MTESLPPALPDLGLPDEVILGTLAGLRELDVPTKGGRTTSYVYDSGIDELEDFGVKAFAISQHVNGLDPTAFPSYAAVENDLVAAALSLLGSGSPDEVGTMTSGGTESCSLAVLCARERWRARNDDPQGHPTVILPDTVHPAFLKAAHLFDVEPVRVPVDPETFKVDVEAVRAAIDERTALVVVSAPSYAHGVIDPLEEVAAIAAENDVLCHVDACIGGWTVPFIRAAEGLAPIGLMIPGVTSVSVDLHKYAYTPKGVSVLLFANIDLRKLTWFATADWAGYPVVNPTLLSTRGGGSPAIAWAYVHKIGREGYRELALSAWRSTQAILAGIEAIPGIHAVGTTESTMYAFTDDGGPDDPDVRVIVDEMVQRGWILGAQPGHGGPPTAHMCVMAVHEPQVETFLADLAASVEAARALGRVQIDPNLLALAQSIDPADLPPEAVGMMLSVAGISLDGNDLPDRRATLNAIIDAAPGALVERLLVEVLGQVLLPSKQSAAAE